MKITTCEHDESISTVSVTWSCNFVCDFPGIPRWDDGCQFVRQFVLNSAA